VEYSPYGVRVLGGVLMSYGQLGIWAMVNKRVSGSGRFLLELDDLMSNAKPHHPRKAWGLPLGRYVQYGVLRIVLRTPVLRKIQKMDYDI
jgi:hypothetical protein